MSSMGTAQLLLIAIVAAVLLVATNHYAKQQRKELTTLEPPASLDSVGTWEAEVLAAEQARAAAGQAAQLPSEEPEAPPGEAGGPSY